jgi:hypothetical protein
VKILIFVSIYRNNALCIYKHYRLARVGSALCFTFGFVIGHGVCFLRSKNEL